MKYQDEHVTLMQIDCMDYMATLPDKFFDLAIVDPEYGINAPNMQMGSNVNRKGQGQYPGESAAVKLRKGRLNSGGGKLKDRILNTSKIEWDNSPPPPEYFIELRRISKHQIIWGGNYFDLPPTRCVICWDKLQPWENFSQWEMAWTSFDYPAAMFRYSNTGGTVTTFEKKIHPTQKPVALYKWLMSNYAKPGWKLFDSHGGSMSSAIAAYDMGFHLTLCEKDEDYFKAGVERYKKHIAQGRLFEPEALEPKQQTFSFKE